MTEPFLNVNHLSPTLVCTEHSSSLDGRNPKLSKPRIKLWPSAFRGKKIWVNSTFLGAAIRDSVKVVEKSVKSGAKCHETGPNFKTLYLGLGRPKSKNFKA